MGLAASIQKLIKNTVFPLMDNGGFSKDCYFCFNNALLTTSTYDPETGIQSYSIDATKVPSGFSVIDGITVTNPQTGLEETYTEKFFLVKVLPITISDSPAKVLVGNMVDGGMISPPERTKAVMVPVQNMPFEPKEGDWCLLNGIRHDIKSSEKDPADAAYTISLKA